MSLVRALLLLPVQIDIDSSLNSSQPFSSASNVCVGEPVTLSIGGIDQLPGGLTVTNYEWTVSTNGIEYYNPNTIPQVPPWDPKDLTGDFLYFYYVLPKTETVSCTMTFSTGDTATISGIINVVAPTDIIDGTFQHPMAITSLVVIVLSKDDKANRFGILDAQSILLNSGAGEAFVTDGGGSTACWTIDKGFFSKAWRHRSSPDNKNTVTNYFVFTPDFPDSLQK